jgi:hypothetical protein
MSTLEKLIDCVSKLVDRVVAIEKRVKRLEELWAQAVNENHFVPWPKDMPPRYNACTDPCDMFTGPCACGAWHHNGV